MLKRLTQKTDENQDIIDLELSEPLPSSEKIYIKSKKFKSVNVGMRKINLEDKKVYDLFVEAAEELENYPNVITVKTEIDKNMVAYICHSLRSHFQRREFHSLSNMFMTSAACEESLEKIGIVIISPSLNIDFK